MKAMPSVRSQESNHRRTRWDRRRLRGRDSTLPAEPLRQAERTRSRKALMKKSIRGLVPGGNGPPVTACRPREPVQRGTPATCRSRLSLKQSACPATQTCDLAHGARRAGKHGNRRRLQPMRAEYRALQSRSTGGRSRQTRGPTLLQNFPPPSAHVPGRFAVQNDRSVAGHRGAHGAVQVHRASPPTSSTRGMTSRPARITPHIMMAMDNAWTMPSRRAQAFTALHAPAPTTVAPPAR